MAVLEGRCAGTCCAPFPLTTPGALYPPNTVICLPARQPVHPHNQTQRFGAKSLLVLPTLASGFSLIPGSSADAFGPPKEMKIADNLRLCPSRITAAEVSTTLPFVIPSGLRISYHAAPINGHVCGFLQGEPHEVYRRHRPLTGNPEVAEGPAVRLSP
jgi:hypothetical protein